MRRSAWLVGGLALLAWAGPARGQASPPPIVVVFEIENRGSPLQPQEVTALTDYLGTKLAEHGRFHIVPSGEVRKRILQQKKESYKSCYDQGCQIEIGRELAAQLTVSAHISRLGKHCIITAALYDLRKAATVNTATGRTTCSADALLEQVEQVAAKLESGSPAADQPEVPGLSPAPPPGTATLQPVMAPRTKSVWMALFWGCLPGGGMFYLEDYLWGAIYLTAGVGGLITGVALSATTDDTQNERSYLLLGFGIYVGVVLAGMIHAGIAAASWEDPDAAKRAEFHARRQDLFRPLRAGEPGGDPHPAVIFSLFSTRF